MTKNNSEERISIIEKIKIFWKDYVFLLRVPIFAGILLLIFPLLANTLADNLIQNLFVMRGFWQLVVAMMGATMAALMVSFTFERIFDKAHKIKSFKIDKPLGEIELPVRYFFVIVLVLFNWIPILLLSSSELENKHSLGGGFLIGLTFSIGLAWLIQYFGGFLGKYLKSGSRIILPSQETILKYAKSFDDNQLIRNNLFVFLRLVIIKLKRNISNKDEEDFLGIALGVIGLFIYTLTIVLYKPGSGFVTTLGEAPALVYIYLLIWMITGVLGMLTFILDRFRIPIIILLVLFSGFGYWAFKVDHYYELSTPKDKVQLTKVQIKEQEGNNLKELKKVFDERLKNQPKDNRTLVVVTASGGGIQASGWTAQVLGGLQEELGISFTQATGLISSVSGGSVGTMYFLDGFDDQQGYPVAQNKENQKENCIDQDDLKFRDRALNNIFCNATEDWLDAVGWGIAYPDLLRLTGWFSPIVDFISDKYTDRGSALEQDWQMKMHHPGTTLANWQEKSINGKIPIPVFNATFVEDGRRFLISPLKLIKGDIEDLAYANGDSKVLDFRTLYRDYDLNVTTAARLSATFPYVSPLPRNSFADNNKDQNVSYDLPNGKKFIGNYHVADGGYFDNSGIFTVVELLSKDLDRIDKEQTQSKKLNSIIQDLNIKRILLLQINASSESKLKSSRGDRGWFMESIGPLEAAYKVRDSTQISRNLKEVKLLKKLAKNLDIGLEIESFTIFFPEGYNQPLSWRLTKQQKKNLKLAWKDVRQTSNFKELKKVWNDTWKVPSEWKTQKKDEQKS